MNAPLYTTEILRLAASLNEQSRALEREDGRAELRSPTCGSRITLAVQLDGEGRAIMLCAALIFVTLFRQLKLGATLGYIVAGALIGPQLMRLIRDPQQLLSITDLGIALLLFIVGLELQPSRLWRLRDDIFGL